MFMLSDVVEFIRAFSTCSFAIPLVSYLTVSSRPSRQHHLVAATAVISGIVDLVTYFRLYNHPMLHNIYALLHFGILSIFYYELVYKKRQLTILTIFSTLGVSIFIFSSSQYGLDQIYWQAWIVGSCILVGHAIVYLSNISTMVLDRFFDANLISNMIFNGSIAGYSVLSIFIFLLQILANHDQQMSTLKQIWTFHNYLNILYNIGLAIGFFYTGKREIYMSLDQLKKIAEKLEQEGHSQD